MLLKHFCWVGLCTIDASMFYSSSLPLYGKAHLLKINRECMLHCYIMEQTKCKWEALNANKLNHCLMQLFHIPFPITNQHGLLVIWADSISSPNVCCSHCHCTADVFHLRDILYQKIWKWSVLESIALLHSVCVTWHNLLIIHESVLPQGSRKISIEVWFIVFLNSTICRYAQIFAVLEHVIYLQFSLL